ncbi:MAG: hypothetical protein J6Q81_06680, partial [Lentisphaeria bacterium]|nr:hypothetical protein [Lentisphaeria bacterium]
MSESNLQYDSAAIAKRILAQELAGNIAVFHKKQQRFDYAGLISLSIGIGVLLAAFRSELGLLAGIAGIVIGIVI